MATSSTAPAALAGGGGETGGDSILFVESDGARAREWLRQLRADGFLTLHAHSAGHARSLARVHPLRAVLLGELDAPCGPLELLAEIRAGTPTHAAGERSPWERCVPVLVLSDSAEQLDLLRAFEAGTDDFLGRDQTRSYLELRARLGALLRRAEGRCEARLLRAGTIEVDPHAQLVRIAGIPLALSPLEYALLLQLMREPRRVCSKQQLLRAVWGRESLAGARTVDSHASRLRRKLAAAGAPGLVVNVWGVGYRLT